MAKITESSQNAKTGAYTIVECVGVMPHQRTFARYADMVRAFDLANDQVETYINGGRELIRVKRSHWTNPAKRWIVWSETKQNVIGAYSSARKACEAMDAL